MTEPKTIDVVNEQLPVKVEPTGAVGVAIPPEPLQAPPRTAAQAKVEAIADLTAKAYSRASELKLTTEEIAALQAPFGDECFQPGAAGKSELIYIEHASLRDRLNQVIGLGQWALIPRSRWAEDFQTQKGVQASRVYVEAMLMVRGCFVSEAVGEMEYYPKNASQNYGDAVEGAKTAALRRCCKEFGIGLQAWKKDWCQGWWDRRLAARRVKPSQSQPQSPLTQKSAESQHPIGELSSIGQIQSVVERNSKPDALKKWTAYFVQFTVQGKVSEAATFDKKIADLAHQLSNTNEMAKITTGPGNKPGTRTLLKLEPAEQPPEDPKPAEPEDNVPFNFDAEGKPIPEGNTP